MGGQSIQTMQADFYSPPRASGQLLVGGVAAIVTSAAAAVLDLRTVNPQVYSAGTADGGLTLGPVGQYLTIFADTTDVGLVFGATLASVTGANAPALATVGTVNASGVYSDVVKCCFRIATGQSLRVLLQKEHDIFMGFVSTGAGIIRLFQSNPSGITNST
jgi:hypothetical protein